MAVRPICVEQRLQRLARNRLKLENPSVIVTTRSFGNPWGEIRTVSYATYSKRYRMIKLTVIDTHSDCCFCFSNCSRRCRTFSLSRCALCKQFISTTNKTKTMQRRSRKFRVLSLHKLAKKSRKCCSIVDTGVASYGALGHVLP